MEKKQHLITIRGSKGKGGGGSTFEADDNMFARQSAAFIDAIAEGPIKGLVYGDASILVDEVRLRNVNQSTGRVSSATNFNNFTVITKNGEAQQVVDADFFAEYPSAAYTQDVGSAELLENEPQYFTISSGVFEKRETDYVKITVSTTGMSAITKKGDNKGDINTTTVYFTIDFNWVDNSGVHHTKQMFDTGFNGKVSGKYAHTFGFNIETIKANHTINDWSVKVNKLTSSPDSTDSVEVQNAIYVDSIEASICDKLEYPYTAYIGGVIDAEAFNSVPQRGYEIDGKLIQIPSNHYPLDYNGRKLVLSDASDFAVGDVLSQSLTASAITASGTGEEGYTATATVPAHGVAVGETFKATIATTVTQDEDFYEGTFVCTATTTTQFTYTLNKPFDETANSGEGAYKTLTSTTCGGTKTCAMFSGGLVDKKVSNTLYVRSVAAETSVVTGTITNGDGDSGTVTSSTQVFIPANYRRNASTEKPTTSEQDWDGTFYQSWCNNPAWVYNDLITNKIYGLGNYLAQEQVNKWELFQIGRYCDELVPAGVAAADLLSIHCTDDVNYTGDSSTDPTNQYEPRFSANVVIAGKNEAFKVLNDVTSIFRGMTYWLNGESYVVQDSEKDPIYQFTNANVIDGEFKYEGTANKTRTNSIVVNWNNPQDYYRSRSEIVELEENLQKDNEFIKPEETTAFGCTSRGQARRLGKWKLFTNNWNTNTVSFSTSLNAAFLRPGDIVQVIDQHKEGKSWGGRISTSSSTTAINIDRKPTGFADGTGTNGGETGYSVADYRLTISYVGYKATLAQDTATINVSGTNTAFVRGQEITTWRDSGGAVGTTTATGSTSGSSTTVTLTAHNELIKPGMYVTGSGITAGDTVVGYDETTLELTLSSARTVSAATLTFGWEDANNDITLNNEQVAASVFDTSGNMVFVQWTPFTFTETQTLSEVSNSGKTLTVASAFNAAPSQEAIWVISRAALATGKTKKEAKLFRVMAIAESGRNTFEITGLEYNSSKFDAIDKNEALTQDRQIYLPDSFKAVPAVTVFDADPVIKRASSGGTVNSLVVDWEPVKNDDGTLYNSVRHYQLEFSKDNAKWFRAGTTTNTDFEIQDGDVAILSGTYYFRIYTVSLNGVRSPLKESGAIVIDFNKAVAPAQHYVGQGNYQIACMGNMSGSFSLNTSTGAVSFSPANFQHNDGTNEHTITGQGQLAFSGLDHTSTTGGDEGYIYFDEDGNSSVNGSGVFKAIAFDETSGQFHPVGTAVFATAKGDLTASTATESRKWTGVSDGSNTTDFDGELAPGNVFKYVNNSNTRYHRVTKITSDSVMSTLNPTRDTLTDATDQAFSIPSFLSDFSGGTPDTIMGKVTKTGANTYVLQSYGSQQGESGFTVFGTNESHVFAASSSGAITNSNYIAYTNDFTVKKGEQAYAYAASGTAQNTFGITLQSKTGFSNNTDINISGAGQITIDDNCLDSVSAASATLRITDLATATTITDRVLSFAKANAGVDGTGSSALTVKLLPSNHVIPYNEAGAESSSISFTTEVQNISELSGTAYYDFDVDTNNNGTFTDKQDEQTATFTLAESDEPASGSLVVVRVQLRDGNGGTVKATDLVTIYGVKEGSDAYTVINTNSAHTLPTTSAGVITYTGSGTDIRVFKGSSMLEPVASGTPTSGEFKVTPSATGITVNASPTLEDTNSSGTNDTRSFGVANSMTAAVAEIEYAVNCENLQTVTTAQTFSKSIDGSTGASVNIIFKRGADLSGSTPSNSSGVPSGWEDDAGDATGTDLLWASRGQKAVGASVFVWTTPFQVEGAAHAEVYIYRKNSNAGNSGGSYNFTNNTLTAPTNWVKDPPALTADGDKVYVSVGLVTGASTATAATPSWGTAVVYAQRTDGATGATGRKVAELSLFYAMNFTAANSFTAPSAPSTSTYDFSDGLVSNIPSGWSQTKPPIGQGIWYWETETLATESSTDNTSNALTWGTPHRAGLPTGDVNFVFKRASSQPTSVGTTNWPAVPSGWEDDIGDVAAGSDEIWASKGTTAINNSAPYTFITTWQDGVQIEGSAGPTGAAGDASKTVYYLKTSSPYTPPSPPSGNITATSGNDTWRTDFPGAPSAGNALWQSLGNKPSGGSWAWGNPIIWFDKDRLEDFFEGEHDWDFSGTGLGKFNLTEGDYSNDSIAAGDLYGVGKPWAVLPASGANNYSLPTDVLKGTITVNGQTITIPQAGGGSYNIATQDTNTVITYTSGAGHPSGTAPPAGSQYIETGTDPDTLWISNGSAWQEQTLNKDTTYTLPTYTSGAGHPSGTAPPAGSQYIETGTTPDTLWISNGSTWVEQGLNSDTTYSAANFNITALAGYTDAAYANSSVVATATIDGAATVTWSKFATGNFNPNTTSHTWSVTWKNGAGTTVATSTVVANLDTTNTDLNAPTITANATGSGVTSSVSGTGTTSQTITLSRSGFNNVVLKAVIYVVTGFSFKFNGE